MPEERNSELFRIVGGHPALDMINTVTPRPAGTDHAEALRDPADLLIWARRAGVVDAAEADAVAATWRASPSAGTQALHATVDLREAAYAAVAGRLGVIDLPDPGPVLERITLRWSAAAARSQLLPAEDPVVARLAIGAMPEFAIQDRLAHATMDLLRTADLRRIRACPITEGGCGWLFADHSRNNSRRWCAMEDCGSRTKAERLTARRRTTRATIV